MALASWTQNQTFHQDKLGYWVNPTQISVEAPGNENQPTNYSTTQPQKKNPRLFTTLLVACA